MGTDSLAHHDFAPWRCIPKDRRAIAAESYWQQPLKWNRAAQKAGERRRVFCASLADVFEDRPELEVPRDRLFELISSTPWLDWLLLTKRPENIKRLMWPASSAAVPIPELGGGDYLPNVWLGVSVEDQQRADERIPLLLQVPAAVRFLSVEPLLGDVWLPGMSLTGEWRLLDGERVRGPHIDWVIVGGESGPGARPMHPEWARGIRDQCKAVGVPMVFKQWGEHVWAPDDLNYRDAIQWAHRQFGGVVEAQAHSCGRTSFRVGKARAGRLLDGVLHDEYPRPREGGAS